MPIQVLPDEVASQIAAGEVVERPASVVKELMENALDAGATNIHIQIEQSGRRLIEVADDGSGIPAEEMLLAVMRHATSKLANADDLFHLRTLGFRGEALASIGSVSRMTLTSCVRHAQTGGRLRIEGGRVSPLEIIGAPPGTVVKVEDLFYNVPARLKFLKKDATERQVIDGLIARYSIAYPHVRVQVSQDGHMTQQTSGDGDARQVLANLYGVEIGRQMLEVSFTDEDMQVSGFTSPVGVSRSNRREITFFINGRWIQDAALSAALLQAYHTLLMVGRYPLCVLFIEIPPEAVDVNVHPAKAEVRFRQPDRVFTGLQRAVRRALLAYSPAPKISPGWTPPKTTASFDSDWQTGFAGKTSLNQSDMLPSHSVSAVVTPDLPGGQIPIMRLVGQIANTYLVAEGPDGLYLVDQHAAHERVLYERYLKMRGSVIPSQPLLQPALLTLPPHSAHLLEEQLEVLGGLGFQVEAFGPGTFRIRAVPAFLSTGDPSAAVRVVIEDFEEDEAPLQAELENRLAARICKRLAVKAGQVLSQEEQRSLLQDLENCQSPRSCPHGRPTMIHLSVDLLERQFGRRGSR